LKGVTREMKHLLPMTRTVPKDMPVPADLKDLLEEWDLQFIIDMLGIVGVFLTSKKAV
jgi:hypothetical protein